MLLVRSIFWLTLAYIVIKPGVDLADTATALSNQAVATGTRVVAEQVQNIECDSLQCLGGKAVLSAAMQSGSAIGTPMHETPIASPVPFPRPRPDRAG
ncbi:MAG TPA: hypothetical protein VN155_00040 [Devosia sp.]|nr:hypothetical protein [Devosia sp.]